MKQLNPKNHCQIMPPTAPPAEENACAQTNNSIPCTEGLNIHEALSPPSQGPEAITHTSPQQTLTALARLLGRQAANHVRKYRFEGLGHIQIVLREAGIIDDV